MRIKTNSVLLCICLLVSLLPGSVCAHPHEEVLIGIPVDGVVDVVHGAAVIFGELIGALNAGFHGQCRIMLLCQRVGCLNDDFFEQGRNILIVVVKGIAADIADIHNAFDADFIERALVQQADKCRLDSGFGVVVRHDPPPFRRYPVCITAIIAHGQENVKVYPEDFAAPAGKG